LLCENYRTIKKLLLKTANGETENVKVMSFS